MRFLIYTVKKPLTPAPISQLAGVLTSFLHDLGG
jgi:hypothetical protein